MRRPRRHVQRRRPATRCEWVTGFVVGLCALCGGCRSTDGVKDPVRASVDAALADDDTFYRQVAHEVAVPADEETGSSLTEPPATLRQAPASTPRLVSLEGVVRIALANASIVRDDSQFLSASNTLLANPAYVPSAFDASIQGTGGPYGIGGIETAKAQFDPYFLSGTSFGRNNLVQNNRFISGGLQPGSVLEDESGSFTSRLEKRTEYGSFLSLNHDLNYTANNQPNRFFPSSFAGLVRAEMRQPLLAGFGKEFTQIAGPVARTPSAVQPVDRGLVVSRINERVSLLDFEANIQNLLRAVKTAYWDLALAQRVLDDQTAARDAAEELWQRVGKRLEAGLDGVDAADEAQARERFHLWRITAANARADVIEAEARLRRLMGLPAGSREPLRTVDEPHVAALELDWSRCLAEALTRRVELRRQKALVKSLGLQHRASQNLQKPRLDLVGGYQLNGFGDDLLSNDPGTDFGNPYVSLANADQAGWDLGVQLSMPFGNRSAKSLSQNIAYRMTKARAALRAQEVEIGHELAYAFRELDRWQATAEARKLRLAAAEDRTQAVAADYDVGRTDLDTLLRAQTSLLQARIELAQAKVRYQKAIIDLQSRKGTLMDDSAVRLSEGTWDARGYAQALQQNWQRTRTFDDIAPVPAGNNSFEAYADGKEHPNSPSSPTATRPASGERSLDGSVDDVRPADFTTESGKAAFEPFEELPAADPSVPGD